MRDLFSKRREFKKPPSTLVRNGAPKELRRALLSIFERHNCEPYDVGSTICYITHKIPQEQLGADPDWYVVSLMIERLHWYQVYDLVELLCPKGLQRDETLEGEINELFEEFGIGWKIAEGQIQERGDHTHERVVGDAIGKLQSSGRPTAADEMKEAIVDLSRRPDPDTRGAVTRAVGAIEALARDVTKLPNPTLGQLVYKLGLTAPLDQATEKIWGYACEKGRHAREGQSIGVAEAYLVVNFCAALASYLCDADRPRK